MEIKLAGFMDAMMNSSDKKNVQNQDEFSEIFSALLLNILPNLNNQQLAACSNFSEDESGVVTSANMDSANNNTVNLFSDLSKLDSNFTNLLKDFKANLISDFKDIEVGENIGNLAADASKFNSLVKEFGKTIKAEDVTELSSKLTSIIAKLEDKETKENIKVANPKFASPLKVIKEADTSAPLTIEEVVIQSKHEVANGLDIKSFNTADDKKIKSDISDTKEVLNLINNQGDKNGFIKTNSILKADTNNSLELSRLIAKPEDLVEVAVEKFKSLRLPDRTELSFKLRPEELGEITVKLVLEKGQVNGNIMAENKDVVNMLKSQIDGLKQELKNNNVNLSSLNVSHSGDNLLNSGRGGREFSNNNSSRPRKYEQYEDLTQVQEEDGFTIMA